MKNKGILIVVFVVSVALSFALGYFVASPKTDETKPSDNVAEKPNNNTEEKQECDCNNYCQTYLENINKNNENSVELTKEQQKAFDAVSKYGDELYKNKKYETLQKNYNGVYYASLKDLENMGYDISMFKKTCDKTSPIIYFDVEYKLDKNYANGPLQYSIECNEVVEQ